MTSPTKFLHVTQVLLYIWKYDQSSVTVAFLWEQLPKLEFYKGVTRKRNFFEGGSWLNFNNLGLALGMA